MPGSGDYGFYRRWYPDLSGSLKVTTGTTGTTTLVAARANYTLNVQKIHVHTTTGSAGVTWRLEDSATTPVVIDASMAVDAAGVEFDKDYGPVGYPLTEGKGLNFVVSAAGAAGVITYTCYQKLTAVTSVS